MSTKYLWRFRKRHPEDLIQILRRKRGRERGKERGRERGTERGRERRGIWVSRKEEKNDVEKDVKAL